MEASRKRKRKMMRRRREDMMCTTTLSSLLLSSINLPRSHLSLLYLPAGQLTKMQALQISGTRITENGLQHLTPLRLLRTLTLSNNQHLTSILPLSSSRTLTRTHYLKLEGCQRLQPETLEPMLRDMPELSFLVVADGAVPKKEVARLAALFPSVTIRE